MTGLLYFIWFLIPTLLMLFALWVKLESIGKAQNKGYAKDLFIQALFVYGCSAVSVVIDLYLLEPIYDSIIPDFIPLPLCRFLLLPAVLYIGALIVGGSQQIRIAKYRKIKTDQNK